MTKIKARAKGIDMNNVIRCRVEFDVYMTEAGTTDDIMEAMEEFQAYLKDKLQNQTISDKFGTFIHRTKEVRLV